MNKKFFIALAVAGLFATSAVAAPATITDPNGSTTATVNLADRTLNVRALATNQTVVSARKTVATSASQFTAAALTNGVVIRALSSNAASVCIGGSGITTSNGYCIAPGEAISFGIANMNQLYVIGANGTDVVMYTGN